MLVRDPAKRYTLAMVKKHPWMRAEVPQCVLQEEVLQSKENTPPKSKKPFNEQVLRVMQSLGIDPNRTKEVIDLIYTYLFIRFWQGV